MAVKLLQLLQEVQRAKAGLVAAASPNLRSLACSRLCRPRNSVRPSACAAARQRTTPTTAALSAVVVSPLMAGAAGAVAASAGWLDSAPLRDYWTALAAIVALCLLGASLVSLPPARAGRDRGEVGVESAGEARDSRAASSVHPRARQGCALTRRTRWARVTDWAQQWRGEGPRRLSAPRPHLVAGTLTFSRRRTRPCVSIMQPT